MSMRLGVWVDGAQRVCHLDKPVAYPQGLGVLRQKTDQVHFGKNSETPEAGKPPSLEAWLPSQEAFVAQFNRTIGASPLQKAGKLAKNFLLYPVSLCYGVLMLPMIMYNLARGGVSENPLKLIVKNATAIREGVQDDSNHEKQYDLLHSKAPALLRQGKVEEALGYFNKALKAYPRLVPDTYITLGECCQELLEVTRTGSLSYSHFGLVGLDGEVLDKLKNSGVPYEALGAEAYDRVRYMEAHGVQNPEGTSRTLLLLGNLHEAAGNGPKALQAFQRYLEEVQNAPVIAPKEDEEVPEDTHSFTHPVLKERDIEFAKGRLADALSVFGQHEKALAMAKELIAADEHPNGE